jgi:hypothetical protein
VSTELVGNQRHQAIHCLGKLHLQHAAASTTRLLTQLALKLKEKQLSLQS